jgi:hypothetical protein
MRTNDVIFRDEADKFQLRFDQGHGMADKILILSIGHAHASERRMAQTALVQSKCAQMMQSSETRLINFVINDGE